MKSNEVIRAAMAEDNLTQLGLATRLGYDTQSYVGNALNRKTDMKVGLFVKMMKAMGYEVIVRRGKTEFEVTE